MGDGGGEVGTAPGKSSSYETRSQLPTLHGDRADPLTQQGRRFFDITDHPELGTLRARNAFNKKSVFPEGPKQQEKVSPLLENLSKKEMEDHLTTFTSFHTRYYKVTNVLCAQSLRSLLSDA